MKANQRLEKPRNHEFGVTLRKRIDANLALQVIESAATGELYKGKPVTALQLKACQIMLNKCLPDLTAVSMDIAVQKQPSIEDLNTRMQLSGMNPDQVWKMLNNQPVTIESQPVDKSVD